MIARVIVDLLQLYLVLLMARIIMTWFPIDPWTRMGKVVRHLGTATDPVLRPVRRIIPPLRVGGMGIDLSPIIVIVAIEILINVVGGATSHPFL